MKKFLYIIGVIALVIILISIVKRGLNDEDLVQVDIENKVSLVEEYSEKIVGEWRSKEDEKSLIIFNEDGTFKDVYNSEGVFSGSWEIKEEEDEIDVSFYLYERIDEEVYKYEIIDIDEENLLLIYLTRGNILEYEKTKR
jgi:hypothetical protein